MVIVIVALVIAVVTVILVIVIAIAHTVLGGAPWLGLAAHNFELARPSGYSTLWLRPAGAHRRLRNLAKQK